ncbi:MAG: hypothetical protein SFW35_05105 [Chitinophagales bacterium]|nr:hypothetical protein [Chitinophagales bacterium]
MFTNISWTEYLFAIAVALVIYYSFVGVRYFPKELKELVTGKIKFRFRPAVSGYDDDGNGMAVTSGPDAKTNSEEEDAFAEVEELIGRLKEAIANASRKKYVLQEFRHYLQLLLREYPNIKNSDLRSSINELIVSECERHGVVALSEEEADMLWNDTV